MKKAILLLIVFFSITSIFAQNDQTEADTTKIKIGNKTIIIIEKKDKNVDVKVEKEVDVDDVDSLNIVTEEKEIIIKKENYNPRKFSRWSGINLSFNQFVYVSDKSAVGGKANWNINPWESRTWNINIMEFNLSLIKRHLLLTTGLGFQFRKYSFDKNIDLVYDRSGNINAAVNEYLDYDKDRLSASYVQIPLLLEINTSSRPKKGFYLAAGVIGGYKMSSKLKQVYEFNDQKVKKVTHDDFNLNPYQLEGTIRIGINRFTLFTNLDMIPVFRDGEIGNSNDLANVTFGIQLIGF